MAGVTKEHMAAVDTVKDAEKAAARAWQEKIFADAKSSVAKEAEDKERRYQEALIRRANEEPVLPHKVRDANAIYRDPEAVMRRLFNELSAEEEERKTTSRSAVEKLWTEDGEVLYSLPNFNEQLQGDWEETIFEYAEPDQVISQGNKLAIARESTHLMAHFGKLTGGGYRIEMIDTDEHPMTQLRLCGELRNGIHPDLGDRLGYVPDTERFIHPTVKMQTEHNLSQLVTVLQAGSVTSMSFPLR